MLKSVKSNPYYFIKGIALNPSKHKENITFDIVTDAKIITMNGLELPKDTYENGIPFYNTEEIGRDIFFSIEDYKEYQKANLELSKDYQKSIEEIKTANPNSLIDELGEIVDKQTSIYDFLGDDLDEDDEKLKEDLF